MQMSILSVSDGVWKVTPASTSMVIATKDTYVDKNIEVDPITSDLVRNTLEGITLPAPDSGENKFYVEVPNGSDGSMIKFYFHVTSTSNVYITDNSAAIVE